MGLSIIPNWCRIYSAHKCPQYHLIHLVRARSKADDMCQWSMPLPHCYTGSCKKKTDFTSCRHIHHESWRQPCFFWLSFGLLQVHIWVSIMIHQLVGFVWISWLISWATPNITQLGSSTVLQICQSLLIPEHSAAQHRQGLVAWLAAAAADDHRPRERGRSEHLAAADGSLASAPLMRKTCPGQRQKAFRIT